MTGQWGRWLEANKAALCFGEETARLLRRSLQRSPDETKNVLMVMMPFCRFLFV
jgi:hypothetical protein